MVKTFEEVYREHVRFVWRSVRRLGVEERDVEDVVQLVFEIVHRQLATFRGDAKVSTWLFAIVYRVVRDHRRSAYARKVDLDDTIEAVSEPEQELAVERGEARALLDRLLETLDDDKRATFVLCELEGLAVKDVAELMGCPVKTTYARLEAARVKLERAARRLRLTGGDEP